MSEKKKCKRYRDNGIREYYEKKRLLCDQCKLCSLSVEEIKQNYDDIIKRITVKEK